MPAVLVTPTEIDQYEFPLLHAAADRWAAERPQNAAVLNATRGTELTWGDLRSRSVALAAGLARLGFRKGDVIAVSGPLSNEHILMEYACFRLGVIHVPLDLRLHPSEVVHSVNLVRAKGYVFTDKGPGLDFAALAEEVRRRCDSVEHFIPLGEGLAGDLPHFPSVLPEDPAQIIFTTGSTGSPKPALLSHRGITCQNLCLARAFHFGPGQRVLCNLPASHVGGQAELLLTTLSAGGTAVTLETFDPVKSLDAVERYGVTLIGQIPAMFQMEWRTADYKRRNFSSLQRAVYGGQSAPRAFLQRMREMAPEIATGLGLTEASGFCTYTELTGDIDAIADGIGWAMPAYPMSIRQPMNPDGAAGAETPEGQIGHVCFRGPQNFLGYLNDPEATAAALSRDGWLYTGDMGRMGAHGLRLSGRAKWVLKPAGNQVFPGDIEARFAELPDVANVGVVGEPHRIWSEGIIAFVEKRPGAELSEAALRRHARSLTSYMRPLHYVILDPGAMPLNRTAKVDVTRLREMAAEEVRKLRERGRWDAE